MLLCFYAKIIEGFWDIVMFRKFSGIFSRIASALLTAAIRHPTHFPAVSSVQDLQEGERREEFLQGNEVAENKDGRQPR